MKRCSDLGISARLAEKGLRYVDSLDDLGE